VLCIDDATAAARRRRRKQVRVRGASVDRRLHRVPVGRQRGVVRRLQRARSPAERPTLGATWRRRARAALSPVSQDELCARRRTSYRFRRVVVAPFASRPSRRRPPADVDGDVERPTSSQAASSTSTASPSAADAPANCTDHVDCASASKQRESQLFLASVRCTSIDWP